MPPKRRKVKQGVEGPKEAPPAPAVAEAEAAGAEPASAPVEVADAPAAVEAPAAAPSETDKITAPEPPKEPPLVLTSDKSRGVYECDYCHADISQVPRIRCAICPDFDLCLDCFASADHSRAIASLKAVQEATDVRTAPDHDHTHGYRVCDSTRYVLFPPTRAVVPSRPPSCVDGDEGNGEKQIEGEVPKDAEKDKDDTGDAAKEDEGKRSAHDTESADKAEKKDEEDKTSATDIVMEEASAEKQQKDVAMEEASSEKEQKDDSAATKEEATNEAAKTDTAEIVDATSEKQDEGETETKDSGDVLVVQEDPKCTWTVEEDLRLLDAIKTCGLGNWADIAETIAGQGSSNKTPKRCMERYLDDFLGRYGHIVPPYTVVEYDDDDAVENGDDKGEEDSTDETIRSSKRRRLNLMRSYSAISILSQASGRKKRRVVPTATLPGYDDVWPSAYLPPIEGVQIGQEVGRVTRGRAEQAFVKEMSQATSKEEADRIYKEWEETRLNKPDGPTALPIRPDDLATMPGSELAGYMPRRGDFDMEWENDAEAIIADMEFSANDLPQDRQLKIQIIQMYNAKLDERERRKQFLLNRGLVNYRKNQKADEALPRDERDLVRRMRLFERLHTPEEHKQFIADILKAKRLRKEIAKLQTYRRMGIKSIAEAEKFELDKQRREFHKQAQLQKDAEAERAVAAAAAAAVAGTPVAAFQGETESSSYWKQYRTTKGRRSIHRSSSEGLSEQHSKAGESGATPTTPAGEEMKSPSMAAGGEGTNAKDESATAEKPAEPSGAAPAEDQGASGYKSAGYELLSSKEVALCESLKLSPAQYVQVKSSIIQESMKRGLLDKSSGSNKRTVVKIDAEKRGHVVDFMVRSGWISSKSRMGISGLKHRRQSSPTTVSG